MAEERIQKILSHAGIGARRKCEDLIIEGRVSVNGRMVCALGEKADPERDEIAVDNKPVRIGERCYILFNKPAGCLSTAADDRHGRKTVMDFFADFPFRVYPVGRLDFDTEGLLLLTNDGAFSQKVLHPKHKVHKTYEALVEGVPSEESLARLRTGIELEDGPTAPARLRLIGVRTHDKPVRGKHGTEHVKAALVEILIREGRKRQVRRMFRTIGHDVIALKRIRIGALELGDVKPGESRVLTQTEASLAMMDLLNE